MLHFNLTLFALPCSIILMRRIYLGLYAQGPKLASARGASTIILLGRITDDHVTTDQPAFP